MVHASKNARQQATKEDALRFRSPPTWTEAGNGVGPSLSFPSCLTADNLGEDKQHQYQGERDLFMMNKRDKR